MARMFGNEDETTTDASVTAESTTLRQGAQAVFIGSACLLPWFAPVAVFGMIAAGAIILATAPTAACQKQITAEIDSRRFGCAWLWWSVMAAIIIGAAIGGLLVAAEVYTDMSGL